MWPPQAATGNNMGMLFMGFKSGLERIVFCGVIHRPGGMFAVTGEWDYWSWRYGWVTVRNELRTLRMGDGA